ncbi:unnamed protein product [Cuscuta campestris]|uniref:Uncharacterized protein n=1 Tax=Cuscuta campestris TaxID=132261 RepID=A0A484MGJ6_9ASTE|nr:unnamed protein product [Cuscuta campestris]
MAPSEFRVCVKDQCIVIADIDLDIYFTKDLYEDVILKAKEQNVSLPRFLGFTYHPPNKEIQKLPLASDLDWIKMIEVWGVVSSTYIPLYVIELQEPSSLQKMAEKLDSSTQNFNEGSDSEVEFWVDNLLVTPTSCSDILETELNTGYKSKLNVRRQINRRTEVQLQPSLLHPEDVSITDSSPQVSPITARPDKSPREEFVNDEILKNKKTKHVGGERKLFERTEFNVKLLTKELKGLEAYDISALSKPQIPPEVP